MPQRTAIFKESYTPGQNDVEPKHQSEASDPDMQDKIELTEDTAFDKTGFAYPTWKKWSIITVIFVIQCSMNLNAALYSNAVSGLVEEFHITGQAARVGQCVFLVAYAFGCELWAPWSEELSLGLVNLWQIPCAVAPNYGTIVVCRILGGLSSAGGSVTLGMVADMWDADNQQFAVAYIVLSSVGGSVIGPIIGGFVEQYLSWHWAFWIQLIFGATTQLIHFFFVPETRTTIMLDKEAKRRRKAGERNIYGPNEMGNQRISLKEVLTIWYRPFEMFLFEPIVLCLSLLSGFSDALIFTFLEAYSPVYKQWNFRPFSIGLAFVPLLTGYLIAYVSFFPTIASQRKKRAKDPDSLQPEARLWWLLYTVAAANKDPVVPTLPLGLFGFAWTSLGPDFGIPWIAPMIFSAIVGIANYAVYMATVDYMIASYGPYSASATGGNGFSRDFLAGIAAMYSTPFYEVFPGRYTLAWPTTILAIIGIFVAIPVYIFYWKGPTIRAKSKFAQVLAADGKATGGRGLSTAGQGGQRAMSIRRRSLAPRSGLDGGTKHDELA
ncbi:MAG: hypothetical protein Q9163_001325 [Psora crenata]